MDEKEIWRSTRRAHCNPTRPLKTFVVQYWITDRDFTSPGAFLSLIYVLGSDGSHATEIWCIYVSIRWGFLLVRL